MKIFFANFAGSGFAEEKLVEDDVTLGELLVDEDVDISENNFKVSINGQIATETQKLFEGDKVRLTPRKIAGA